SNASRIICVGHEPDLTGLMLDLTGMTSDEGPTLRKAGCYGIRLAGGRGHLEWMLSPPVLIGGDSL
ncbi:MAG TPA: hypothetical protein VFL80_01010, partial [Thermoanaerobaculia bacterium]|nr:hypothetical protein [Thermoanaerobaculia bacterium]